MTEPFTHIGAPSEPARYTAPAAPSTSESTASSAPGWSLSQRVAFRFVFPYLVLFVTVTVGPFLLADTVTNSAVLGWLIRPFRLPWTTVVPWVGTHVLHLGKPISMASNGSGDTTFAYVQLLCFVILAVVATAVWSILDRKRPNYARLHHYLRILSRYALALTMLSYASVKLIKVQFPYPDPARLFAPVGLLPPMALLWTMMGSSAAYNIYAGIAEAVGAVLLFRRQTTTVGALLVMAAMSNVVMLNLSYDVPVKILSTHLLLIALFLAAPGLHRVYDALLLGRAVPAEPAVPHTARRTWRWGQLALKGVLILCVVGGLVRSTWRDAHEYGDLRVKPPLYGIWEVTSFARNHHEVPPLLTDTTRWRYVVTTPGGQPGVLLTSYVPDVAGSVYKSGDFFLFKRGGVVTTIDTVARHVVLVMRGDPTRMTFAYTTPDSSHLELTGAQGADSLHVTLRRIGPQGLPLVDHRFHWIQDPYNR